MKTLHKYSVSKHGCVVCILERLWLVHLLTTFVWPVEMVYCSSYETTLNSSSDVQWTLMVSWDAVHSSSRIVGAFGAVTENKAFRSHMCSVCSNTACKRPDTLFPHADTKANALQMCKCCAYLLQHVMWWT